MTTVIVLIAVILGGLSYSSLGLRSMPEIEFPMATITTIYPGGSPEEIETEITRRIEDGVSSIAGIDAIQSYSQQGMSLVLVSFRLEEDIDVKAMDIRDKLDLVRASLPEDVQDPIVGKFDIGQMPVMTLALVGPQPVNELYRMADEDLRKPLSQVPGVADIQITGGQRREIQVLLDPALLRKHNVSPDDVARAIQSTNLEVPAGHITEGAREYTIRTTGRFSNVEQILRVPIRTMGGSTLELRHVGRVEDTFEEERSRSHADGQHSVILTVLKQSDANEVGVADGVRARKPELDRLLPPGAQMFIAEDASAFIRGALSNVASNLLIGVLLTSIMLYLFVGSWRGMLIAVVVIPAAVVVTFSLLLFSGFTLNILTLTALALSVGIVVNNSIMILENAERFLDKGLPPVEAAIAGTKDIGLAVFASMATNLVVFLPMAFMGEIVGRFFKEFGLTIVYATVVSLLVSYTLTPMMCGALLKARTGADPPSGRLGRLLMLMVHAVPRLWGVAFDQIKRAYLDILDWCLRWRAATVAVTVVALVASLFIAGRFLGMEFFPQSDEGQFKVSVETPVGSSLDFTETRVLEAEGIIRDHVPYLEHYYGRIGRVSGFLGSSSTGTNIAEIGVVISDKSEREQSVYDILNDLRPRLAQVHSAKLTAATAGHMGAGGKPISVELTGEDLDELRRAASEVVREVEQVPGTSGVDQSWRTGQPEIRIVPHLEQSGRYGLSARDIALTVRTYLEGSIVSQFKDRGEDYDVRIKLDPEYRRWSEDVKGMFIKSTATGEMIPIGQVAEPRDESGPTVITRKDRRRLITVGADLTGERPQGTVENEIRQRLQDNTRIPRGVNIGFGGQSEMRQKNFAELFKALGTASILTFLCVAGIIESFVFGTVIILSIPVSLTGVVLAMLIGDVGVSILALMAMIMLVGMVVNSAIVVLDYATRPEHKHLPPVQRVREACEVRFRVMAMANLTAIVAMVPLSLGMGFAAEIFQPIAIVQIGGILASGTLALLVVPAVYAMIENRRQRMKGRLVPHDAGSPRSA